MIAGAPSYHPNRSQTRDEHRAPAANAGTAEARTADPKSVAEALDRARRHTRQALAESVAAARALLDAASIGLSGAPASTHRTLADLARALDQASAALAREDGPFSPLAIQVVLDALDGEIERWEKRSQHDDDARAVLRAFLGLREILWELGLRPRLRTDPGPSPGSARAPQAGDRAPKRSGRSASRVQRVTIEG